MHIYFSKQVVYTTGPHLQVKVHAEVVDPKTGHHDTTNTFHFTLSTKDKDVPPVMPKSYAGLLLILCLFQITGVAQKLRTHRVAHPVADNISK